ncbi:MAG TPA: dihydroorotate dehydrogenase [Candidatus Gracilibacteria bacterium]
MQHQLYDITRSYDDNYNEGPFFDGPWPERVLLPKKTDFLGFKVNSPVGVPAGPLLNSNWIETYAKLGFDIVTYKNVRSVQRACHPLPNCVFVENKKQIRLDDGITELHPDKDPGDPHDFSITNSFGVPSQDPKVWMADIERANNIVGPDQVVITGVMPTPGLEGRDMIEDCAYTAAMVKEAGAKIIELNFSCPNVRTGEGSIYADGETSSLLARKTREVIGSTPLVIKIGYLPYEQLKKIVLANVPYVDAIAGINTIPKAIKTLEGQQVLPGDGRLVSGVCGKIIRDVSQEFAEMMVRIRKEEGLDFTFIGVGGIMDAEDALKRLDAGADVVMSATAAMWNPYLAVEIQTKLKNLRT